MSSDARDQPNKNVDWFTERPDDRYLTPVVRRLFETYSEIPADKVVDHIVNVRNESWKIYPYPCIGRFRFLDLGLMDFDEYGEVLDRMGRGERLLDLGCCFGQEIRKLIADGAPPDNIYGCDLKSEFTQLGYDLFKDRDRLRATFLAADIFDQTSALSDLKGSCDMIYAGSFFHLFDYEQQCAASRAVAALLMPRKGSMLLGRQIGAVTARETPHHFEPTKKTFQQSPETFKKMWSDLGKEIGIKLSAHVTMSDLSEKVQKHPDPGMGWISFVVRREE